MNDEKKSSSGKGIYTKQSFHFNSIQFIVQSIDLFHLYENNALFNMDVVVVVVYCDHVWVDMML